MKPINLCVVVFNRYDLLAALFQSLKTSTVMPSHVYIVDRGHNMAAVIEAIAQGPDMPDVPVEVVPLDGQSLPAAWNWSLTNVPEERIIASDDIEFHPESLETFALTPGDFVGIADGKSSHFACFSVRDSCIEKVGLFDEKISPDYMYFEDCDYARRMLLLDIPQFGVSCLSHGLSKSWERKTADQQNDHHRRFVIAERRYIQKWGGEPLAETFVDPHVLD